MQLKHPLHTVYLLFVFVLMAVSANGNSMQRAYNALKVFDYFKAKKIFGKSIRKHPVEAGYGLALIFYRTDNPFHNFDSAYKYIEISNNSSCLLNKNEWELLNKKYQINLSLIKSLRNDIHESTYALLFVKSEKISIQKLDSFLIFHSINNKLNDVLRMRDSLAFIEAYKINTTTSYFDYILNYPESYLIETAKLKFEKAQFLELTKGNSPEEFELFIKNYPRNKFVPDAENSIFYYYMNKKDVNGMHNSINKFPSNKNISTCWKMIYSLSVPEYSPDELESFLIKYPDFPYKQTVEQEVALLNVKLYPCRQNNRFGFIDSTGTPYVLPFLEGVEDFSEGLCVAEYNGHFGYVSKTGETVIAFKFDNAESFKHGLAIVQLNGKSVLIDRSGNYLAQGFDDISDFNEGLAVVEKNDKAGAIDMKGKLVIDFNYEKIGDFCEGLASVQKNGKYGFIDHQENMVIPCVYDWAEGFKNNLARIKLDNKYAVINKKGEEVIKPEFDRVERITENIFIVVKGSYYGFIEKSGCLLSDIVYDYSNGLKPDDLSDGQWLRLIKGKQQNLMNLNGKKMFTDKEPDEVFLPKEKLVRFSKAGKFGFMDETSKQLVIKNVYDDASDFWEGISVVNKKGIVSVINHFNKTVYAGNVDDIKPLKQDLFLVSRNNQLGLINKEGDFILNCELTKIEPVSSTLIMVEKQGKMAYFDWKNKVFIWKENGF